VEGTALNDLVVAAVVPRLLDVRLAWCGKPATAMLCDGVILSTPTGTTAYSLSLGGPIVAPTAECLVMTPHAAHVLGARSLVFGRDDELRVRASADARLVADGDEVGRVPAGTDIVVRRAAEPTLLICPVGGTDFFSTLTAKLNWPSADPRRAR
jgi:NAD+ kinase